jgi:hypothetical protein
MCGIFPGLVRGRDAADMMDLWLDVPDMQRRCINVSRVALSRESGREWFWAYNLIKECWGSWPYLNGMLVRQGVRADREPLADWLDAAYTLLRELLDEKARLALESRLRQVPRGVKARPVMSSRQDLMGFAAD